MPRLINREGQLSPQLQEIRALARAKPRRFIESQIKIANRVGNVVDFKFQYAQRKTYQFIREEEEKKVPVRLAIIKWRRAGVTSCMSALDFVHTWSHDHARVAIIAHLEDRAKEILQNHKDFYDSMDPELQLEKSKDNIFGTRFEQTKGQALIATCENPIKVRGDGVHVFGGSEYPHWGYNFKPTMREILPVVPALPGSRIVLEGTGSIRGSEAHDFTMAAKHKQNEFRYEFLNWLNDAECAIPFRDERHQQEIYDTMDQHDPRLRKLAATYHLTPEQAHQLWFFYHFASENDFDYCCREFPVHEELAWSTGGASFFGQLEINQAVTQDPMLVIKFDGSYIAETFSSFDLMPKIDPNLPIPDYSPYTYIKVWSGPRRGGVYAFGADSSLGEEYGDYSAGSIRDIGTRELMATMHGRLQPPETAHLMVSLAKIFNNAVVGPECNEGGGGMTVMTDIQRLGYHRLYTFRKRDSNEGLKLSKWGGWWTTSRSRPLMLGEMRRVFLDCIHGRIPGENVFRDISMLNEMRTFVPDPNTGIPRAMRGCYDDRVMGDAITHQICADEAYMTDKDLIHAYHRFSKAKSVDQKGIVQRVSPAQAMGALFGGGRKTMGRGFEIDNQGRITAEWLNQ
jgi:hypothetical protein